ncbi:uncharacterized protein LOC101457119 [Ceratitis capitata]|uniref:(Mediterranean fruit fly) hypothetical protein n=1 Tax=Ceratitis capitata TaxID=7213 RepID=A0A811VG53_CERCA|nr:uncharacterized protein LOC101457119 [Ceratitis capitata]CAD7013132.1 unnamed protein product [Ceratitis capitata]
MNYSRHTTAIWFTLILILWRILNGSAQSFYDLDSLDNYNNILDRQLPSGYYYISDGRITPVSNGNRRKDYAADAESYVYFTPIVRVKHHHAQKKKLFVPNLFG